MRIGYYIPGWAPGSVPNGIVTYLGNLGRQLREMGHEVFYVTPFSNAPDDDPYVTVLELFKNSSIVQKLRFKWNFENALFDGTSNGIADAVQNLIRDKGIEIFQMEETHGLAYTVMLRVSIPVIVRLHGPWFLVGAPDPLENRKPENRHRLEREGRAIRHAAGVTAPSNNVLSQTTTFYGQLKCPTEVIPNPVPSRSGATCWKLDACDRDVILFVGRFDRVKGADLLLRAFAKLAQERPKIRLRFVGPDIGLASDDGRRVNFAEFVDREIPLAIRDRIECRGPLPYNEIEKLRVQAYLTVVCSRFENFANTVMESMATGCPTVATNVGGIPEMLVDNRNGLLAPAEDVDGLACAIARLFDEPKLAINLGEQAAQDCRNWFEPRKIAQRTLDFYAKAIARHKQLGGLCSTPLKAS